MSKELEINKWNVLLFFVIIGLASVFICLYIKAPTPRNETEPYHCVVLQKTFTYSSSDNDFSYTVEILDVETSETMIIEITLIEYNTYDIDDRIIVWAYETDWGNQNE